MTKGEFISQEFIRAKSNLYKPSRKSFGSAKNLADWFIKTMQKQNFQCFYCETSIFDIRKLIEHGELKTRAVKGGGRRGPVLEIDKNNVTYEPESCVLSCYYCNNDKSSITTKEDYKKFFGKNRNRYFNTLLKRLN